MEVIPHDATDAPALERFTIGIARPRLVVGADVSSELRVFVARFEDGGRNVRHTHTFDQVFYVIDGEGFVATDHEERRLIAGDIAVIPAGEPHWHGAAEGAWTTHLAFGVPGRSEFEGASFEPTE